jgi:hypothetical protein
MEEMFFETQEGLCDEVWTEVEENDNGVSHEKGRDAPPRAEWF